jgi:hypothetical protein
MHVGSHTGSARASREDLESNLDLVSKFSPLSHH